MGFRDFIKPYLDTIYLIAFKVLKGVEDAANWMLGYAVIDNIGRALNNYVLSPLFEWILSAYANVMSIASEVDRFLANPIAYIQEKMGWTWNWIQATAHGLLNSIWNVLTGVNWWVGVIYSALMNIQLPDLSVIISGWNGLVANVQQTLNNFTNFVSRDLPNLFGQIVSLGNQIASLPFTIGQDLFNKLLAWVESVVVTALDEATEEMNRRE